ncbi:MAG: hypothetical protein IJN49_01240 [Clostridia bacterium]|nr:hypothetical protein [Clostridia bacterium]
MKRFLVFVLSFLMIITILFSVPVVANAIETKPEFIGGTVEVQKPTIHNDSSAASTYKASGNVKR